MRNFQVAFGIRKRSFISVFSVCMALSLSVWLSYSSFKTWSSYLIQSKRRLWQLQSRSSRVSGPRNEDNITRDAPSGMFLLILVKFYENAGLMSAAILLRKRPRHTVNFAKILRALFSIDYIRGTASASGKYIVTWKWKSIKSILS